MDELDSRKQLELDIETEYGIPVQQEHVGVFLNTEELEQLETVFGQLPPEHLEGIQRVSRLDEDGAAIRTAVDGLADYLARVEPVPDEDA